MSQQLDQFEQGLLSAMPMLRRFAISLTRDGTRAEDLVQETMIRALEHREQFNPGSKLDAWLTTILRNYFRSDMRKRRREVEDADGVIASNVPFEDSPLKKMEASEVLRVIDQLKPQFRVPLRAIAHGASYEEVAFEIREHIGTVKSRVNRGRNLLKAME